MKKIETLKIQIRSAQNVSKVWISRKKSSWPYLGPSEAIFLIGRKNILKIRNVAYFAWWANGPCSPGVGPCCYPTRDGAIGNRWSYLGERRRCHEALLHKNEAQALASGQHEHDISAVGTDAAGDSHDRSAYFPTSGG